ncbi:aminopeptidase [Halobacteriales archaeon Cl-PHB]
MSDVSKAAQVADIALSTLTTVKDDDSILLITDEAGMERTPEIIEVVFGTAIQKARDANLIVMADVTDGTHYLPDEVAEAMAESDIVLPLTQTTLAPSAHHEVPERLREEKQIRTVSMTRRSMETFKSDTILGQDFEKMNQISAKILEYVEPASTIHVTSEVGTDLEASLKGMPSQRTTNADDPGDWTSISWGEVYQAPEVGSTQGTAVIDGPVLQHGWPESNLVLEITDGKVQDVRGDEEMSRTIRELVENNENGSNIAELSFGINPNADVREEVNIWKQGLGRVHIAVGNGLIYGQPVDSPIHVDFMINEPTVEVDGERIVEAGELVI